MIDRPRDVRIRRRRHGSTFVIRVLPSSGVISTTAAGVGIIAVDQHLFAMDIIDYGISKRHVIE